MLHPVLSGYISITDGLIQHDASGLKLHDIQLAGSLLGGGQSRLSGSFKAQEGSGELQADIDLSDVLSPRFEMTLTGEQLTLFDSPELLLVAEPDIKMGWDDGSIEINGRILIPRARIAPKTIPASTSSESADLVIVAGEIPGSDKEKGNRNRNWPSTVTWKSHSATKLSWILAWPWRNWTAAPFFPGKTNWCPWQRVATASWVR